MVNKTTTIDSKFRNFAMEILAGETDFITTVKEHGLMYEMDFSKVHFTTIYCLFVFMPNNKFCLHVFSFISVYLDLEK